MKVFILSVQDLQTGKKYVIDTYDDFISAYYMGQKVVDEFRRYDKQVKCTVEEKGSLVWRSMLF